MPTRTRTGTMPAHIARRIEAEHAAFVANRNTARIAAANAAKRQPLTTTPRWTGDPAALARLGITADTDEQARPLEPTVDRNGYTHPAAGLVDWAKQDRLTNIGRANHQPAGPTPRGAVVGGSSKTNRKRK